MSFQALSCHGKSLKELKLQWLTASSTGQLSLLKLCTNLVSFSLIEIGGHYLDLGKPCHDAGHETIAWLKKCTKLQKLACTSFACAPALMKPIFLENSIHLTSFEYEYSIGLHTQRIHKCFHQALANQTSLQKLCLKVRHTVRDVLTVLGNANWLDGTGLVECLSKLVNLTDLRLGDVSDFFVDEHIAELASCLPKLEVCLMNGYGLTDAVWGEFGSLRSLRRLELDALTRCSKSGILGFIKRLGPGNQGLVLSLTNADVQSNLLWDVFKEEDLIQETISKKVQGIFEFEFDGGDY